MGMLELIQISVIPATLVVLGALLVLHRESPEKAGRSLLLYLLACLALVALIIGSGSLFWQTPYDQANFYLTNFFLSVLTGIMALIVLQLGTLWSKHNRSRRQIVLTALLLLVLVLVLIGLGAVLLGAVTLAAQNNSILYLMGIGLGLGLVLSLVWAAGLRWKWLAGFLLILVLVGMIAFNEPVSGWIHNFMNDAPPEGLGIAMSIVNLSFGLLTVPLLAVLVQRAMKEGVQEPVGANVADQAEGIEISSPRRQLRRESGLQLGAAAILLAGLVYTIYWTSIWDQTSDGLGGIFLAFFGTILGTGAGMLLTIFSTGRRRLVGILFLVFVPMLLIQAINRGWQVSYHAITEKRASTIATALESYHARTSTYPQMLNELIPRDILFIPQPVILQGESWCYKGSADSYRLGAVFREYFSSPLSIQIYASAGEPLDSGWECDARLAELKQVYDAHFNEQEVYLEEEVRQPQSEISVPRQMLEPAAEGTDLLPGSWSPDGRYLTFSRGIRLQFLDVSQSLVCPVDDEITLSAGARDSTAWLLDGQLLVVTQQGGLILQAPCAGAEALSGGEMASFSEVLAADPSSSNILLKAKEGFWILDGDNLALKQVEGVAPNPYELHWDQAAWLPGGKRLAISRLNGRDRSQGSTLYLIEGTSGEVQLSLPRPYASDQSAPHVEWLSQDELLLSSEGVWTLLDLTTDPPQERNVLHDLFGLDLVYPDDISGGGSVIDLQGRGYYLAVRANHPRNQSLYLYSSASDQVQAFEHPMHSLLFFPDGQMLWMPKFEPEPAYQDEYELVWVDSQDQPEKHLVVAGHTPRSYPMLFVEPVHGEERLYFSSSQGVSLVTVPEGDVLAFWDLGGGTAYVTGPKNAVADQRFVAVVDGVGLFIIPDLSE